jgi:dTDP-4-amino-4,6-dideoxygalactose transaminase
MKVAEKHKLPVVEDSCQCILGNIEGKNAGTWGNAGGFSLHPLKNLNVWGDGGMIVTNDDALAAKLRLIRNHGLSGRDEVAIMGCNSRLDTTQAVIGNWLIGQVDFITNTRIKHASMLDEGLSQIPQITLPHRFADRKLVFHLYMVFAEDRDNLLKYCKEKGIEAKVHYPVPVYLQKGVTDWNGKQGPYPVADRHGKTMISFPAHEHLTDDQVLYTVQTVADFYAGK